VATFLTNYGRVREVVEGPDGYIYFTTSNRDGRGIPASDDDKILRIASLDGIG
jgi:glucose/arabinose dehydrogenase